ncbi:MAG: hypothetical protein ACRDRR_19990 [Pseudonocardiaceae bacterium]
MADHPDLLTVVRAVLAEIDAAHARAVVGINSEPNLDAALAAVSELATHVRKLSDTDAELRTLIVGRVWDAESLSLAALADRIGVSKARADQLIRNIKRSKQQTGETDVE